MPTSRAVLDASAIVALVMRERGADVIVKLIEAGVATTTPTGLAEALITCRRKGYNSSHDDLVDDLRNLGLTIEPLVEADASEMAFLLARSDEIAARDKSKAQKAGKLSLGDVACLAVAQRLGASAVVSDGTWELLDVRGLQVLPFR